MAEKEGAEHEKAPARIRLFNTLSRSLEDFQPIAPGRVGIYCCGPTVYDYQHIGNLRTYVFEDVLARVFRYGGYRVKHVMNITDVGHLVSDADEGEDKMEVARRREKKSSREIADYYTDVFFRHAAELNIRRPDVVCRATEHIGEMIALVERLEQRGFAYRSAGNVYFDVSKFSEYGRLARLDLSTLRPGARIEVDQEKRGEYDFALWFTRSKFGEQELQWDSPWGRGYPGWHLECSAMSMKYLGEQFDIHCGGIDHIPVHHTNEIAQSQAATGQPLANYWLHGGFLVAERGKMSKSAGDFITLDDLTERGLDPLAYRLFCLGGTYRNELSWSWEAIQAAQNTLRRLKSNVLAWKRDCGAEAVLPAEAELSEAAGEAKRAFDEAVFDDLAMPRALSVLHAVAADQGFDTREKLCLFGLFDEVLGLGMASWKEAFEEIPSSVQDLVESRRRAREQRDFAEADRLRSEIEAQGYVLEDSREGTVVRRRSTC